LNKSIEALLRGYVRFDVNGTKFWRYNSALEYKNAVVKSNDDIEFIGYHIFKGWLGFFYQYNNYHNTKQILELRD
jgi:hypothetical protein